MSQNQNPEFLQQASGGSINPNMPQSTPGQRINNMPVGPRINNMPQNPQLGLENRGEKAGLRGGRGNVNRQSRPAQARPKVPQNTQTNNTQSDTKSNLKTKKAKLGSLMAKLKSKVKSSAGKLHKKPNAARDLELLCIEIIKLSAEINKQEHPESI